jgi:phosphoribosylformylglycinamidine cyclo-ligase
MIKGMAHITGGGITDNLPRSLPEGTEAVVDRSTWQVPPIFEWLQRTGQVPDEDMLRAFNMGIGLVLIVPETAVAATIERLQAAGEANAVVIGTIREGRGGVVYSR